MGFPAVFLDRDNTLIDDPGFIDHPDKVVLKPGALEAVRRFRTAGYRVVVASNQSGVARGLFDEKRLSQIHDRLKDLLRAGGAPLDAVYYCPYLDGPEATVEQFRKSSDLRKPAPGMLTQAARELDLDLERSWMIGDSARDVQAGRRAGCRTVLLSTANGGESVNTTGADFQAPSLLEAAAIIESEAAATDAPNSAPLMGSQSEVPALLGEIRDLLDQQQRSKTYDDFSLLRLVATVVQMLALLVLAWGVAAMLGDDGGNVGVALMRFALAGLLQLLMLTLVLSSRRGS